MNFYAESLVELIDYCSAYGKRVLTPSDLTYKALPISRLDELQTKYEIEDIYPLSPMQEGMLFHSVFNLTSGDYFRQTTCQLQGELDIRVIEQSMNKLMARHQILRTVFEHEGYERPIQIVLKERKINFSYKDIRQQCSEGQKEEVIKSYQQAERSQTFDLTRDVLMRLLVLQTGEEEFEFIWNHHHVLMDGWCMGIVVNEFTEIYSKLIKGQQIALPLPSPYSRYITWLEDREKEASVAYWRNYLTGYHSLATLPQKEKSPSGTVPYAQRVWEFKITEEQVKLLDKICKKYGVTLNTIFQCAWGLLLAKYNNVNDVVFGSVVSGRPAEI